MAATLYIVSTPIGNLKDITIRAIETLKSVDFIVAEDTRRTLKLLNYLGIKKRLISFYKPVEQQKTPKILEYLRQGKDLALVSDAGTPLLSDPGYALVKEAIKEGFKVVPVPGPSSVLAALVASGLSPVPFSFYGFVPRASERRRFLESIRDKRETIVLFEAPNRLKETLKEMLEVLGDRNCCIAREITKIHEEFIRGRISEILDVLSEKEVLGEICILIEGAKKERQQVPWKDYATKLHQIGYSNKEIAKILGTLFNISRKEVYNYFKDEVRS